MPRLLLSLLVFLAIINPIGAQSWDTAVPPADGAKYKSADFRLWLPENVRHVRGILIRQHGCGRKGLDHADDVMWQALAKKHDCALLGSHFVQDKECADWFDPANGSEKALLTALKTFAKESEHPEMVDAPWAIWGHSGGALWAMHMMNRHPERTIAVFARSQAVTTMDAKTLDIPTILNYGIKEITGRFEKVHLNSQEAFTKYRAKQAFWATAIDPKAEHDCRNNRHLAMPFFDAALMARLPLAGEKKLRPIDAKKAWIGNVESFEIAPTDKFAGEKSKGAWLTDERVARIWQEFVKTGEVVDKSPPVAPYGLNGARLGKENIITWLHDADLESGTRYFYLYRDGKKLATIGGEATTANPKGYYQIWNFGDEPEPRPAPLRYIDKTGKKASVYEISAENHAGLESPRTLIKVTVP